MIRYIKGTLAMQVENGIVVETGSGVGFEIFVHQGSPIYKHSEGDEIQVFTEMIVSENDMSLYGFHNMESVDDLANVRPSGQVIMAKCLRGTALSVRALGQEQSLPQAA